MKRILFALAVLLLSLVFADRASAQQSDTLFAWNPGQLQKKGSTIAVDGVKLSRDERTLLLSNIGGEDLNPRWNKYSGLRTAGIWTLSAGGTLLVGGMVFGGAIAIGTVIAIPLVIVIAEIFTLGYADTGEIANNVFEEMSGKTKVAGIVAGVGAVASVTGLTLLITGNRGLRKTVKYCNSIGTPQQASLGFGPTASGGVGLKFNF